MSGRRRVRTEELAPERLGLLQEVFGTSVHAYRVLRPYMGVSVSSATFWRVWAGQRHTPEVIGAVDRAWTAWSEALFKRVKSAA